MAIIFVMSLQVFNVDPLEPWRIHWKVDLYQPMALKQMLFQILQSLATLDKVWTALTSGT